MIRLLGAFNSLCQVHKAEPKPPVGPVLIDIKICAVRELENITKERYHYARSDLDAARRRPRGRLAGCITLCRILPAHKAHICPDAGLKESRSSIISSEVNPTIRHAGRRAEIGRVET